MLGVLGRKDAEKAQSGGGVNGRRKRKRKSSYLSMCRSSAVMRMACVRQLAYFFLIWSEHAIVAHCAARCSLLRCPIFSPYFPCAPPLTSPPCFPPYFLLLFFSLLSLRTLLQRAKHIGLVVYFSMPQPPEHIMRVFVNVSLQ